MVFLASKERSGSRETRVFKVYQGWSVLEGNQAFRVGQAKEVLTGYLVPQGQRAFPETLGPLDTMALKVQRESSVQGDYLGQKELQDCQAMKGQ